VYLIGIFLRAAGEVGQAARWTREGTCWIEFGQWRGFEELFGGAKTLVDGRKDGVG
jgi:hypothetical protein